MNTDLNMNRRRLPNHLPSCQKFFNVEGFQHPTQSVFLPFYLPLPMTRPTYRAETSPLSSTICSGLYTLAATFGLTAAPEFPGRPGGRPAAAAGVGAGAALAGDDDSSPWVLSSALPSVPFASFSGFFSGSGCCASGFVASVAASSFLLSSCFSVFSTVGSGSSLPLASSLGPDSPAASSGFGSVESSAFCFLAGGSSQERKSQCQRFFND